MSNVTGLYRRDTEAFGHVVQAAQDQIGIHFDESTLQLETDRLRDMRRVHGQDVSGSLDMEINEQLLEHNDDEAPGLHPKDFLNAPYDLRGLLRDEEGCVEVHVDPELAGPGYPWGINKRVRVSVLSSAAGINSAQELLGRTPGKDAVKLTTTRGLTHYTAGEWLEGFGEGLEIRISDTSDWTMTEHDRQPYDHVQSWIATPTGILMQAAARAREIKGMYGEQIHLPKPDRPQEVGELAHGLDCLSSYTREPMAMMINLGLERLPKPPLHFVYNWVDAQPLRYAWIFEKLGVVPAGLARDETARAMQGVNKQFIRHIASQCIQLDEVRPLETASPKIQAARTKMLQLAIDKYDLAA